MLGGGAMFLVGEVIDRWCGVLLVSDDAIERLDGAHT